MTDFSPLDSALYESTPEKIAASLRYLRKADAVMAALMPLSASTQAPPAAVPAGCQRVEVNSATLNYVAGLLKLSDHHLTNGPHPIERGETYWKAQAAVAIGGVNECAMLAAALAANKENGND